MGLNINLTVVVYSIIYQAFYYEYLSINYLHHSFSLMFRFYNINLNIHPQACIML